MEKLNFNAENSKEAELGNRLQAQLTIAERMGVEEGEFLDWAQKYAGVFADIASSDLDLNNRICSGKMTNEDVVCIRDMMKEYDLGAEDHTPGPELDA